MGQSKGTQQGFSPELFRKAVKSSMERNIPVQIFDATVIAGSQDSTKMTCFVNSVNSNCDNLEVRYHLCISDGVVRVPADDSVVTVAKTAFTDPYIVKDSDLNSYFLGIGNQSFENNGSIQDFESYVNSGTGSFGGMIKLIDPNSDQAGVLFRIQQIENTLNQLIGFWNSFATAYIPGSPSVTGLPATLSTDQVTEISPITQRSDLENPNIIHGLKPLP